MVFFKQKIWGLNWLFGLCLLLLLAVSCVDAVQDGALPELDSLIVKAHARGVVELSYSLADSENAPLSVQVYYKKNEVTEDEITKDETAWKIASPAAGSISGNGIVTQKTPTDYSFLWDSYHDLGQVLADVSFKVKVSNPFGFVTAQSLDFKLMNDNLPPLAAFGPIVADGKSEVQISVGLADTEQDLLDIKLFFSINGGEQWQKATLLQKTENLETDGNGRLFDFTWLAGKDLDWNSNQAVRLKILAADFLGEGQSQISKAINVQLELEPEVSIKNTASTMRGNVPLVISIKSSGQKFDAEISYCTNNGTCAACSLLRGDLNSTINLVGNPQGISHSFLWDTEKDLENLIERNISVSVKLFEPGGVELSNELSDTLFHVSINNAPIIEGPVISEVYSGVDGNGAFIELVARPGYELDGLRLFEKWDGDDNGKLLDRAFVNLDGYVVDDSGVFVISDLNMPSADFVWERFNTFFQEKYAYSLVLQLEDADYNYDGIGIGDFSEVGFASKGEGSPVSKPPLGQSLSRDFSNTDIDDNSLDFIFTNPTPGEAKFWPAW